jgi:hypothetical protein
MDTPLRGAKKEKIRGTSFLSKLSRSIRKFSPKVAEEPQPMEEEPFDEEEDYEDDLEENDEEEAGKNLSFEENRFQLKGKVYSIQNPDVHFVTYLGNLPSGGKTTGQPKWERHYQEHRLINFVFTLICPRLRKSSNQLQTRRLDKQIPITN